MSKGSAADCYLIFPEVGSEMLSRLRVEDVSLLVTRIPQGPLSCASRIQQRFSIITWRSQTGNSLFQLLLPRCKHNRGVFHSLFVRIICGNLQEIYEQTLNYSTHSWSPDAKLWLHIKLYCSLSHHNISFNKCCSSVKFQ